MFVRVAYVSVYVFPALGMLRQKSLYNAAHVVNSALAHPTEVAAAVADLVSSVDDGDCNGIHLRRVESNTTDDPRECAEQERWT